MTALTGVLPAAASPTKLVDCNTNHNALQPAIGGAVPGETLLVTGRCTGPFTISSDLTLAGFGSAVLDGRAAGRTVTIGSGASVLLIHLVITNGRGGIDNQGTLTIRDSAVRANLRSAGPGGGINNAVHATLVVSDSRVEHNDSSGAGGGIDNNGSMTVLDSDLSLNIADSCGGIDSAGTGNTAQVIRSKLHDNTARAADGGGVCDSGGSTLTLSDSMVYSNGARFGAGVYDNGGTESVTGSTVTRNVASDRGAGLYNVNGGTITVSHSAVDRNLARGGPGSGGGIYNALGTVTLIRSSVRDNNPDNCDPSGSVPGCTG